MIPGIYMLLGTVSNTSVIFVNIVSHSFATAKIFSFGVKGAIPPPG